MRLTETIQIVEELEDRLGDKMQDLLDDVGRSLSQPPPSRQDVAMDDANANYSEYSAFQQQNVNQHTGLWESEYVEQSYNELIFDDHGEGAGIEGDLDVEEE
jgi:hypothetical protein